MGSYSIKELERLSNIKAHTLRIWEKRYNLFEPTRTETNIRKYSDNDLKRLLRISTLSKSGIKISKIVSYSEETIAELVAKIEDEQILNEKRIDDLIIPMIEFDESAFNELYDSYEKEFGVEQTFLNIVYPFLEKIGLLWLTDEIDPSQEHFVSYLIRQKLSAAIEKLPVPKKGAKKVLLFLPEGEYHELGLLFFSFIHKSRGILVFYLGQSIPLKHAIASSKTIQPDWILTYTIVKPRGGVQSLVNKLGECDTEKVYFLLGRQRDKKELLFPDKVLRINSYRDIFEE